MKVNNVKLSVSNTKQEFELWASKPMDNLKIIKEILSFRTVAAMKSNSTSSRGHILLQFTLFNEVEGRTNKIAKLSIIDVAGNEDYGTSERMDETKLINLHNSSLLNIIRASITNTRSNEPKTEFTTIVDKVLKESTTVLMIVHTSHELESMRSSKFLLNQISGTITIKEKINTLSR